MNRKKLNILDLPQEIISFIWQCVSDSCTCLCFKADMILILRNISRKWMVDLSLFFQKQFGITDIDLETYILLIKGISKVMNNPMCTNRGGTRYDPRQFNKFSFEIAYNHVNRAIEKEKNPYNIYEYKRDYYFPQFKIDQYKIYPDELYFISSIKPINVNPTRPNTFPISTKFGTSKCYVCHENWTLHSKVYDCQDHICSNKGCNNHIYISECKCRYEKCTEHTFILSKTSGHLQGIRDECCEGYHFVIDLPLKEISSSKETSKEASKETSKEQSLGDI